MNTVAEPVSPLVTLPVRPAIVPSALLARRARRARLRAMAAAALRRAAVP